MSGADWIWLSLDTGVVQVGNYLLCSMYGVLRTQVEHESRGLLVKHRGNHLDPGLHLTIPTILKGSQLCRAHVFEADVAYLHVRV